MLFGKLGPTRLIHPVVKKGGALKKINGMLLMPQQVVEKEFSAGC
jgi:hypothetical protein